MAKNTEPHPHEGIIRGIRHAADRIESGDEPDDAKSLAALLLQEYLRKESGEIENDGQLVLSGNVAELLSMFAWLEAHSEPMFLAVAQVVMDAMRNPAGDHDEKELRKLEVWLEYARGHGEICPAVRKTLRATRERIISEHERRSANGVAS